MLDTTLTGRKRRKSMTVTESGLIFDLSTGVEMPAISVGPGFWRATITHSEIANFSCGIAVNTANPLDDRWRTGSRVQVTG